MSGVLDSLAMDLDFLQRDGAGIQQLASARLGRLVGDVLAGQRPLARISSSAVKNGSSSSGPSSAGGPAAAGAKLAGALTVMRSASSIRAPSGFPCLRA